MSLNDEITQCTTPYNFLVPVDVDFGRGARGEESMDAEEDRKYSVGSTHPLLNDVILRKVFGHVKRNDLLACRGVCKKWSVATIPYTRFAFEITISGHQTIRSSFKWSGLYFESDLIPKDNPHKVENFVELFCLNKLGIPFGKFKLGSFPTTDEVGQKFLEICGDTIHEISFLYEDIKIEDLSELLKCTSKLQTFTLPPRMSSQSGNNVKLFQDEIPNLYHLKKIIISGSARKNCPTFIEEILSSAQNVSDFVISDSFAGDISEGNYTSLEVLRLIAKLGRATCIQLFEVSRMRKEHVDILTDQPKRFTLNRLSYFGSSGEGADPVKLITFFKESLHGLDVCDMSTNILMEFPKMPHLTQMRLSFNGVSNSKCINLQEICPALVILRLYGTAYEEHDEFFPDSKPCLTLRSLQLWEHHLKINGFKHISIILPNLTQLHLRCLYLDTVESLKHIWSQMTQLQGLALEGLIKTTDDLDSLFTGISVQRLQEMTGAGVVNELENMTESLRRETILSLRNQFSQVPSITNLTNLKLLQLGMTGGQTRYDESMRYLTDLTLYFGLYSMKSLKHLDVEMCKFTKTGFKILTEETGLETWRIYSLESPLELFECARSSKQGVV